MQPSRTRHRSLLLLFLVPCIAFGLVATAYAADEPAAKPNEVRMTFVGDIMLDREPGKAMLAGRDPFADVAGLLEGSDFTVGNLECVVADSGTRLDKHFTFRADPRTIPLLAHYFDAVSLANNHTGDFGHAALIETMYRLRRANLPFFGAGLNDAEAHTPWVVEKNGVKIAVLGYNEFRPLAFEAGPKIPGCAWSHDEKAVADIRAIRPKVDVVMTFMHWGEEYRLQPNERQKTLARHDD